MVLLLVLFAVLSQGDEPWTYADPDAWASLPGSSCGKSNQSQSPIDIKSTQSSCKFEHGDIELQRDWWWTRWYAEFTMENNYTFEVVLDKPPQQGKLTWRGKEYYMTQWHYHSPSEHTLDGRFFDMEAHHVYKSAEGDNLVVAVLLDTTKRKWFFNWNVYIWFFWRIFPRSHEKMITGRIWSPYTFFFPKDLGYYHYVGSFTTPPCTLKVDWLVLTSTVSVHVSQREFFREKLTNVHGSKLAPNSTIPGYGHWTRWNYSLGDDNRPRQNGMYEVCEHSETETNLV